MKRYDIFISYRREDGSVAARSLYDRLKRDGYNVFLDVASMTRCEFDKQIKGTIEACKDFILILSKKALNETTNQEDWVREELAYAIEKGKNIIPVFLPDFENFPQNLPSGISAIRTINGLTYNHTYFANYYNSLKDDFLISKPKTHRILIGSGIIGAIILLASVFAYWHRPNPVTKEIRVTLLKAKDGWLVQLERGTSRDSLHFVKVDGGEFMMGIGRNSGERREDESPRHKVLLDDFWMMDTKITEGAWHLLTNETRHGDNALNSPRYGVKYKDALAIARCLNDKIKDNNQVVGFEFRLPTEAEWEYAARGGVYHENYLYCGSDSFEAVAPIGNYKPEVKTKSPNKLGLYDMSGVLYEWCYDWYGSYDSLCTKNPTGPLSGQERIVRGGSYNDKERSEVLNRSSRLPEDEMDEKEYNRCGLRLVLGRPIKIRK